MIDKKAIKAIKESIKHHETNLNEAIKARGEFERRINFKVDIGNTTIIFSAGECALCKIYIDESCFRCPLGKLQEGICNFENTWGKIALAENRRDFVKAERAMIRKLKECLRIEEAK